MPDRLLSQEPSGPSKTADYTYLYRGYYDEGGVCRVRVYERDEEPPVIIVTELDENTNTSITNMAEYLAPELVAKHFPERFDEEIPVTWIEHYPRSPEERQRGLPEYSIVTFEHFRPRVVVSGNARRVTVGTPSWRHIEQRELEALLHVSIEGEGGHYLPQTPESST